MFLSFGVPTLSAQNCQKTVSVPCAVSPRSWYRVLGIHLTQAVSQWGFPGGNVVKNLPDSAGDTRDADLIPGLGRSPGGGHDNPFQYSCLENLMDRGAGWATVHGVAKSWT